VAAVPAAAFFLVIILSPFFVFAIAFGAGTPPEHRHRVHGVNIKPSGMSPT
jgi:hypothetical protein